jgi:hypothetical protein
VIFFVARIQLVASFARSVSSRPAANEETLRHMAVYLSFAPNAPDPISIATDHFTEA